MFADDELFRMINLNGRNVILYKNHTFSKVGFIDTNYYYCSKKTMLNCKAKIHFDRNWHIKQKYDEHNHACPKLFVTSNGMYFLDK